MGRVWLAMTLLGFAYVAAFTVNAPRIDEWEFIPVLTGHEPFAPWLWAQHNEHRFPLPRAVYYALFQLTHDFRTGCYLTVAGLSLLALGMIRAARRLRGRVHFADAFFPVSLLHWGHYENLLMGYQIVFLFVVLLAGAVLLQILGTTPAVRFRRGVGVGLLLVPLLLCGAAGVALAPVLALWLFYLAGAEAISGGRRRWRRAGVLTALALVPFVYVVIYLRGYEKPSYHPESAGVIPSLGIAGEVLTVSLGPVTAYLWPALGVALAGLSLTTAVQLVQVVLDRRDERPRALGLLLVLGAVAALAFAVGWGRSGFGPGMGFGSRYALLTWPLLGAVYFSWLLYGGPAGGKWLPVGVLTAGGVTALLVGGSAPLPAAVGLLATAALGGAVFLGWALSKGRPRVAVPAGLCVASLLLWGFNTGFGAGMGVGNVMWAAGIERDLRAGVPMDTLIERHFEGTGQEERARRGIPMMGDAGIGFFGLWGEGADR